MENNLLIGTKLDKQKLIVNFIRMFTFTLVCYCLTLFLLWTTFKNWLGSQSHLALIISLCFFTPFFIYFFYMCFTDSLSWEYIEILNKKVIINQKLLRKYVLEEAKLVLKNKEYIPNIQLELTDILCVQINCYRGLGGRAGQNAYLEFQFIMRSGEIISIIPECIDSKKGQYAEFVDILENNGIYIIDPYELRSILENDMIFIQEYIIKHQKGEWTI